MSAYTILFSFNARSNDEIPQVSQKELNLNLIQSIAKEIGVNVKIELFNEHATRPLTNSEINKFKNEFLKIAELNGNHLMNRITSKVTATGIVYIQSYTSSFTIYSSGEGSWGRDLIDL